ncbi:uncharacterized protein K489DRAFT_376462 [Dissoconium aciculare CBS 342.82]|uniref:Histone transcription regulator 3 homolog n=1 Tax=Dissoconium aciculare CBS 342.82 TaxID=1314786 RepID=A0A6J3MDH8_9PEZI|nr:uncharacterized protein K489DRAFT_376462 [Dissoconium aciculare CBS 342.82]KAF1826066.1 hypothetical protein K489DRAFT_376462 [Dissoconium aciculare CBS 342.82]
MSGFKALNLESDDESDIEIDDTKEIQIEDALKLYQTALKYHSEGPSSFRKAEEAYDLLFKSDIFKYPESQIELQRIELYDGEPDVLWDDSDERVAGVIPTASGLDTGPSTLPQILHLSHKNYAQFKLDVLSAKLQSKPAGRAEVHDDTSTALEHFVQALDKDDSDVDLWQRTASVGQLLNSSRLARFGWESILEGDDDDPDGLYSATGLEEALATDQLQDLIQGLGDTLSALQRSTPVSTRKTVSKALQMRLRPYARLIAQQKLLERQPENLVKPVVHKVTLDTPTTWAMFGEQILGQQAAEQHGTSAVQPGLALEFLSIQRSSESSSVVALTEAPSTTAGNASEDNYFVRGAILTIDEQFPGLDRGRPTVQPSIAAADASMQTVIERRAERSKSARESTGPSLPSRKRSGDASGMLDGAEEGRSKSKRLRARDSNADALDTKQAILDANARWEYEQQLNEFQAADDWMFETVGNFFERMGIVRFDAARHVRQEMQPNTSDTANSSECTKHDDNLKIVRADLQAWLQNYNEAFAQLSLLGSSGLSFGQGLCRTDVADMFSASAVSKSTTRIEPMPNDGLSSVLQAINRRWLNTAGVAWEFVRALLAPGAHTASSYRQYLWPDDLKTTVVQVLVNLDEPLFEKASMALESCRRGGGKKRDDATIAELVQGIFELHLDIYSLISKVNSGVDTQTIVYQGDRLQRWSELAREAISFRAVRRGSTSLADQLNLRFLWATTFHLNALSDVSQEHVIECMNDLRTIVSSAESTVIKLQNNAIMPEISLLSLDREMSKLTLRDFFAKVTSENDQDPVAVIEGLEPLLETLNPISGTSTTRDPTDSGVPFADASQELVRFLKNSNISLRLSLWQRLREAYVKIEYAPMQFYCTIRMIGLVVEEMKSGETQGLDPAERQTAALKNLRVLQDMIALLDKTMRASADALLRIDEAGMKMAVSVLGEILQLCQVFNVFEDSHRVGQAPRPMGTNGSPAPSFMVITKAVHDMQVQIWLILYGLFKDAISQSREQFPTPDEDRFDFLRAVHRNLGIRGICGAHNRKFVQMLKDEFFQLTHVDGYESEQAQVLHDLYGINCFLNPSYELIEHHCTKNAFLDRGAAAQTVDLLLTQASKLPMKELIKHTLKDTIEVVHGTLARNKKTDAIMRNREVYRAFFKSPINPIDIFACLKGAGNQLPLTPIPKEDALMASKGWYFLMGHIALTKFRSQKRTVPTPTEDLDIAIAFFNQDLDYSMDNWETWFRLAQATDTKIEESVLWSAEKLNTSMQDIVLMQKQAIHCYIMATALAYRSASFAFETSDKMTELCGDFALRLYSSSREPYGMQAFAAPVEDFAKFITTGHTGVERVAAFKPLTPYTCWKLANSFLRKAIAGNPESWTLRYMHGKCLWKMHTASERDRSRHDKPPSAIEVLDAFIQALALCPKKDGRDSKREQILEPHYKLVVIVHKLVISEAIDLPQAREALNHTQYAQREEFPENRDGWVSFMLDVLKKLRAADKSNWYHRMVVRSALLMSTNVKTENGETDADGTLGAETAKNELTQQMFTKTRGLQIWKPDTERPGRHFVYTARYTRMFVKILKQLKDRVWLDILARRVRKKPHDIFEHSLVWQDLCATYLLLLRAHAEIAEGLEVSTFSNIAHEDFLLRKEPLEKWMQAQDTGTSAALDVLREVQELKKVNQGLMKTGTIDDLIGDSYAHLFNTTGKQLWDEQERNKQSEEADPSATNQNPSRPEAIDLAHLMNVNGADESGSTAQATAAPETAPVRRKIGVGRREIRNCAEGCYQKASSQTNATSKAGEPAEPRLKAFVEITRQYVTSADPPTVNSAPGSIHDSADDESELSELEEEDEEEEEEPTVKQSPFVHRPMFPGLASFSSHVVADDSVVDESEDVNMQEEDENLNRTDQEVEAAPQDDGEGK